MPAQPVIMVLGATAAGKSALAMALAQRLGGEIISADAMAVYRELDIGTAKPSASDLERVPHHLVSCLDPDQRNDVSAWLVRADAALADIAGRGRLALVAGGSPLYAKALREGLSAGAPRDEPLRAQLGERYDREGAQALYSELQLRDPVYAAQRHPNDRKRIIRALEVQQLTGEPYSSFHTTDGNHRPALRTLAIGLHWPREILHERIRQRAHKMFADGLIEEVRALAPRLSPEAQQAVGYKEVLGMLRGEYDRARAIELVCRNTRRLAKHQLTWYRGWDDILWLPGDAPDLVERAEGHIRIFLGSEEAPGKPPAESGPEPRDV